jgi:hypothetical protein
MRNPRVFIPQEPRKRNDNGDWVALFDLTPALKFGELVVLLPHGPMMLDTNLVLGSLKAKLTDFCQDDYLMLIGDPTIIAASVMVASFITDGYVKVLKYDRLEHKYNSMIFDL